MFHDHLIIPVMLLVDNLLWLVDYLLIVLFNSVDCYDCLLVIIWLYSGKLSLFVLVYQPDHVIDYLFN